MTKLVKMQATLALAFVLVSLLSYFLLYDLVDRLSFDYVQKELIGIKSQVQQALDERENDDWYEIAAQLSFDYDVPVYVDSRTTETFSNEQLADFERSSINNGILDASTLQIYFPVSDGYVLTVDGVSNNVWLAYVTESFAWLFGFLTCAFVIGYFHYQDQKKLQALADVFQLNVANAVSANKQVIIEDIVKLAANLVKQQQQKSQSIEQLLVTQRDLLHGVAHEFRSPLARMEFSIELLVNADQAERQKLAAQLETSIQELDELVQQLLKYSRLKHDNSPLSLSPCRLTEIATTSIEKVQPFYEQISYFYRGDPEQVTECDEALLVLALVNLLRNAGRFAKSKCCVTWECNDQMTVINVEDDGPGLPPGKMNDIFEPFMRLDPSRSRDSGGHGLGLAIVKAIVERHDGVITAADSEFGGAKFTITLHSHTMSSRDL